MKTIKRSNGTDYTVREYRDRIFTPQEWIKFYDNLKPFQKHTYNVLINTGARHKEAANIDINQDVDFRNRRITLRITKKRSKETPRPRIIPISPQFARYLYRNRNKRFLSLSQANQVLKNTLLKCFISDYRAFSVHNIRKTLESWLLALGVEPFKLMLHFGHKEKTALKHYISPDSFSLQEKQKMKLIIGDLYD